MKKDYLKSEFVKLRAGGYTYEEICSELGISKPTAIKWNKLLKSEITQRQNYMIAGEYAGRITKMDRAIEIRLNTYKQISDSNADDDVKEGAKTRVTKWLEKLFNKRIKTVHLELKNDTITGATFVFEDD